MKNGSTGEMQDHSPITLTEGNILEGNFWPEPVRVIALKKIGCRYQIITTGVHSRTTFNTTLTDDQVCNEVRIISAASTVFNGDPIAFRLAVEAWRIRLAHEFDPHFAVSVSQIDPLPHQLEAVYHHMIPRPKLRFLLADDPGAGKTIMAGLFLKELKIRGLVERTLIVTPANLTDQWRRELKSRFGEVFQVVRSASMDDLYGRNIWVDATQCITSMDFAKPSRQVNRQYVFDSLREARWDLVIVDEAHKMSAYQYGDEVKRSDRYKLGELLSIQADHFLFLTATPHKGDPVNFRLLMQLLDWEMFQNPELLDQILKSPGAPMLRRMKESMVDFPKPGQTKASPLFRDRYVSTLAFKLTDSPSVWRLYEAVTNYVQDQSERAASAGKRGRLIGFTLALLQRRLASSVRAIRRSLERRLKRLDARRGRIKDLLDEGLDLPEDLEEMTEEERWIYEEQLEGISLASTEDELAWECQELDRLITLAREAEKIDMDPKLAELQGLLTDEGFFKNKTKLLIFTEHRDTLDYLLERLKRWGFSVTQIHGHMKLGDEVTTGTRIFAENDFRSENGAQIMVATEAAGEGINLQFCWVMVNYDIPWNPNRLEQRMGRIHRYGQTQDVYVYNMVAVDTREGDVLKTLLDKIEEIRKAMGSDRIYDVISEIVTEPLDALFRKALARQISWEEFKARVAREVSPERIAKIKEATLEGLATRHIDLASLMAEERQARERRLMPEYVEDFFLKAFERLAGKWSRRQDGLLRIDRVPHDLQQVPPVLRRRFGPVLKEYRKATFQKEILKQIPDAELMGPGHPLFEMISDRVQKDFGEALRQGAIFYDPDRKSPAHLTLYHAQVQDGRGQIVGGRLFAIEVDEDRNPRLANPASLLDYTPAEHPSQQPLTWNDPEDETVLNWAYDVIFDPYLNEIQHRRKHELDLTERHVALSLDHLIAESISRLMKYRQRRDQGEDMERLIQPEEARKRELEERKTRRLREITLERNLTLSAPEVIGTALILPMLEAPETRGMHRDEEVEKAALEYVMVYEKAHDRNPMDVSKENLGYDIRSDVWDGTVRYVEVKGRVPEGDIVITKNERFQALKLGQEYWLYIVTDAIKNPTLHLICDPAHCVEMQEVNVVERYRMPKEAWRRVAKKGADYQR